MPVIHGDYDYKLLGLKIAMERLERNLSQEAVARHLGVSHRAVSLWEHGGCRVPVGYLVGITKLFSIPITDLLE